MTLHIRFYRADDFEAVTRLWRRAREAAMPELTARMGYSFEMDQAHFAGHIVASCDLWVAERDGVPVAFMGIKKDFIDYLYVDPGYHRQGIGQALLAHAHDLSHDHLWLYTHVANTMARAFYEKNGFVAEKFGVSPAPENEPDVEYHWYSSSRESFGTM
jgi:GNAT superfamily N-acetyltransferase